LEGYQNIKTSHPKPPIRKPDGSWTASNVDKVDVFATYLESVFAPNPDEGSMGQAVHDSLNQVHQPTLLLKNSLRTKSSLLKD